MSLPLPTDDRILAVSYKAFVEGLAGRDFDHMLTEMVTSALNAIEECADYREATELVIRYQQRKAVADFIRNHINALTNSLGGENLDEHQSDNPESDDYSYSGTTPDPIN